MTSPHPGPLYAGPSQHPAPQPYSSPPPLRAPAHRTTSGLSITAFVLAIVAAPIGLVLGIVALVVDGRRPDRTKGLSIAAIIVAAVLGVAALGFALLWVIWTMMTGVMCGELAGGCPNGNPFF